MSGPPPPPPPGDPPPALAATAGDGAAALPGAVQRLALSAAAGLHYGAQLYVSHRGHVVADLALGESRPGVAMGTGLLLPWLSAAKPVTAVAVAALADAGSLDLDEPVARHLPEFGQNGKERVTARHLLSHSGGFRFPVMGAPGRSFDDTLAAICAAPLETGWTPGERYAYQPASSWHVLAELVRRVAGEPLAGYVRRRIFASLGMEGSWLGMPPELFPAWQDRLAPVYRTGTSDAGTAGHGALGRRIGGAGRSPAATAARAAAAARAGAAAGPAAPAAPAAAWRRFPWDVRQWVTSPSPAESGWGPAHDLGRFYEMLLAGGAAPAAPEGRVLSPAAAAAVTAPVSAAGGWDETLSRIVHWGLGVRVNGRVALGAGSASADFGRHASHRSFGHGGFRSSLAFADPAQDLVISLTCNGLPGACQHRKRTRGVVEAVYHDLGLALADPPPLAVRWR